MSVCSQDAIQNHFSKINPSLVGIIFLFSIFSVRSFFVRLQAFLLLTPRNSISSRVLFLTAEFTLCEVGKD